MFSDELMIKMPPSLLDSSSPPLAAELSVLLVEAPESGAVLTVAGPSGEQVVPLTDSQVRLLCANKGEWRVASGKLGVTVLNEVFFAKLLAFLDEARNQPASNGEPESAPVSLVLPVPLDCDRRQLEFWFITATLDGVPELEGFLARLRRTESYWLVRYLLSASARLVGANLAELGELYGLSYSHFRRVCKQALGNNAKSELKNWRIARSLLEVVEHRSSLTDVALKHGYASSSHFSTEIKNRLGVPPRALADITSLPLD